MACMDENPCNPPDGADDRTGRPQTFLTFLKLPTTVLEWIVIVGLVFVIMALLLPNVDQ